MLENKPYLYLKNDKTSQYYTLNVAIKLQDYKVDEDRTGIEALIAKLDGQENPVRSSGIGPIHPNFLRRSVIRVYLDKHEGHSGEWHKEFKLIYNQIGRSNGGIGTPGPSRSEFAQVLIEMSDGPLHHNGNSVAHYDDAD